MTERIEATVTAFDPVRALVTARADDGTEFDLSAVAVIGGPLRHPRVGDWMRVSRVDGVVSAGRILTSPRAPA